LKTATIKDAGRYGTLVACAILVLVLARLAIAAAAPLAFDEAYYWRLSQHLAGGYLDHPPMFALIIRLGTRVAGDTPLGVRLVSVLLALPATWAVWRAAAILFHDQRLAATAALFFNLTLIVALGTVIVTPDSPLLLASAFVILFLAKLMDSGAGIWWLAVGAAVGAGLLSKYSALFFGLSILAWLLIVPGERRWLLTPWPWLGGLLALTITSPVLLWNADHDWDSLIFQFRRLAIDHFTLRYLAEFLPAQLGLATPCVFILGVMALVAFLAGRGGTRDVRVLLGALVWPLVLYLAWHALHQRVEGNWTTPVFPAFAVAAARAVNGMEWSGRWNSLADWSNRLAVPVGLTMVVLIAVQALFGIVPLGAADPTARVLGAGWGELGPRIDAIRTEIGAPAVLAENHALTGWLAFYLPSHPPVIQVTERFRWANEPAPPAELFAGPLLYVSPALATEARFITAHYRMVEKLGSVARERRGVVIERYSLYRVAEPIGDPLDYATLRAWLANEALRQVRQPPEQSEAQ
jgi:4-amino-4-deoxy-L-arabinose transferase-like glycosyltransferase